MKVSVIVPVRNTDKLILGACIDSLLDQDFNDFEIICVDDCSTNLETRLQLSYYSTKDSRVSVIELSEAVGAGEARNFGLNKAIGEYVIFVDSDDLCGRGYLKEMYEKAVESGADVCICGMMRFEENGGIKRIVGETRINELLSKDQKDYLCQVTSSPCNKLCKREYLINEKIVFQNTPSDNDTYYAIMSVLCTERVVYIDEPLYYYRFNTSFQITSRRNPIYHLKAVQKAKQDIIKQNRKVDHILELIDVYFIVIGLMEIRTCYDDQLAQVFYEEGRKFLAGTADSLSLSNVKKYRRAWMNNEYNTRWFDLVGDYYGQLVKNKSKIQRVLRSFCKEIYVWGRGKRGEVYEQFSKDFNLPIKAVCDIKNEGCGDVDSYGYKVLSTEDVIKTDGVIIATNSKIYGSLRKTMGTSRKIIDLEQFCPF